MGDKTIVALSTAFVESAVGLIRLSGRNALGYLNELSQYKAEFRPRESRLVKLYSKSRIESQPTIPIDSCLATFFPAPNSYTGEDVVELGCHGSLPVLKLILEEFLTLGACLAEPGEFTKRAFLNGKLDLIQAESIAELISAKTELGAEVAMYGVTGVLSHNVMELRTHLVDLLCRLEAAIDFPEEISFLNDIEFRAILDELLDKINQLILSARYGKIVRDGISVAIIGKPNVGKSTLLNTLIGEDRALISHIPGTTRDTIEEFINIEGIPVQIIDTAGLRNTDDEIEQMGIERTHKKAQAAQIILIVLDANSSWTVEDQELYEAYAQKGKVLLIINKIDLSKHHYVVPSNLTSSTIEISAKYQLGIHELKQSIQSELLGGIKGKGAGAVIANVRQLGKLREAARSLAELISANEARQPLDCLAVDLKASILALGEITGEQVSEEVINNIFARFCVGK